jgi:shikimate kinase / 3-dehydroquinate synthase
MTTARQIVLIGLSGVGKSTVGKALAERLGWSFIDTDDAVIARERKTPAEVIVERGEAAFRKIEEEIVAEAAQRVPAVIATGGGAFLSARSRRALGERGFICFLDATPAEVARRARGDDPDIKRPLLGANEGEWERRLEELDAERRPYYNHADLWVPVQAPAREDRAELEATVTRILYAWASEAEQRLSDARRLERLARDEPARVPAAVVDTGVERYPIWVGPGELSRLPQRLEMLGLTDRRAFLISDATVMDRHGATVAAALDGAGVAGASYIVPEGEASKSPRVAEEIYRWLAEQRAERRDLVIALGGGMVGDLAGFVAATYLRGMPLIQAPTSVLAMNDAAIGGKTAVDLPAGKNLVGAFYQPRAVISDVGTLRTLPRRAYLEGFAEVIKHGFILDPGLLDLLERERGTLAGSDPDVELLAGVIARSSRLKALVVSSDPQERGLRAILNYGHTVGHAVEAAGGYAEYLHGEAVAVGMMAAARIGAEMGLIDAALVDRHADLLRAYGLPTTAQGLSAERVLEAMRLDKKVERGQHRFVLLEAPGRAVVRNDVPAEVVERAVHDAVRG